MRKTVKVIAAAALFATASVFTVSAENKSGLYKATASTVEDDVYDLNNVITWNRLKFDKYFGFTSIDSASEGNLALATHLNKKSVLGIEWRGNLWNNDQTVASHNEFTGFYGWENKAVRATFYESTNESTTHQKNFIFSGLFGMTLSKKIAFSAGLSYDYDTNETDDDNFTNTKDFSIFGTFYYTLMDEIDIKAKFFASADFDFKWTDGELLGNSFDSDVVKTLKLTPGLKVQYSISKDFTYGMYASVPFTFAGDGADGKLEFKLKNGFSAVIKPDSLLLNMGLSTELPTLTFPDEGNMRRGNFSNSFYAGFAFFLTKEIRLDAEASITPETGVSFDDVWTQKFMLSLRAKL